MNHRVDRTRRLAAGLLFVAPLLLFACSGKDTVSVKNFVGKWKSSRLETPLYIYENGEWEIKKDDGVVLQYGVLQYKDKTVLWSVKMDSRIGHDANTVVSVKAREFQLRERDGSITTFVKLDQ